MGVHPMSAAEPRAGAKAQAFPRKGSQSGGNRKQSQAKSQAKSKKKSKAKSKKKSKSKQSQKKSKLQSKAESKSQSTSKVKPDPTLDPTPDPTPEPTPEAKREQEPEAKTEVLAVAPAPASGGTATGRVVVFWTGQDEPDGKVLEQLVAAVKRQLPGAEPFVTTGKGGELRGQLTGAGCPILVLAGLPPEDFLNVQRRYRWRLVDALRAGVQRFGFLCTDGNYLAANRQQVIADLLGPLGAPYVAWRVAVSLWTNLKRTCAKI